LCPNALKPLLPKVNLAKKKARKGPKTAASVQMPKIIPSGIEEQEEEEEEEEETVSALRP